MSAVLELHDVQVTLGRTPVLHGLELTVNAGEVHALVGLNGAGKTTAMRVALGMICPDAGEARLWGRRTRGVGRDWSRVGHLIETPFSYPELTARQNLTASAALHGADHGQARREIEGIAERLELTPWLDKPVRTLSLGTRQKVGLAAAMSHRPDLIVLDEPTNALDPLAVVGLRELIGEAAERGAAIVVSSHHFDEISRTCQKISVLHRGRVCGNLDPHESDLERRFFAQLLALDSDAAEDSGVPVGQSVGG